jgi:hypothetical protein
MTDAPKSLDGLTDEQIASERKAFFAWVHDCGCDTDGAWSAWQARAALAAQVAPAMTDELKRYELHVDMDGKASMKETALGAYIHLTDPATRTLLAAAQALVGEPVHKNHLPDLRYVLKVLQEVNARERHRGDVQAAINGMNYIIKRTEEAAASPPPAAPSQALSDAARDVPWDEAQRVCDLPEVDGAIRNLLINSTGDNATCMVREVLRARPTAAESKPHGFLTDCDMD